MSGKTQIRITIVVCIIIFVFVCIVPFPSYRDFIVNEANFYDYTPQQMLQMELFDPYRCGDAVVEIGMFDFGQDDVWVNIGSFSMTEKENIIIKEIEITESGRILFKSEINHQMKWKKEKNFYESDEIECVFNDWRWKLSKKTLHVALTVQHENETKILNYDVHVFLQYDPMIMWIT